MANLRIAFVKKTHGMSKIDLPKEKIDFYDSPIAYTSNIAKGTTDPRIEFILPK